MRVFGIETEYGITCTASPGRDVPNAMMLSDLVVRAHDDGRGPLPPAPLTQSDEALFAPAHVPDVALSFAETEDAFGEWITSRMLVNGARWYVDHAHPEYSGPEVCSLSDLVAYDRAGDLIAQRAAEAASADSGLQISIFKNNTDGKGASYGCHENHLIDRSLPFDDLVAQLTAFVVARSVIIGAGRVGLGQYSEQAGFQLTQRADFFERCTSLETTRRRGLINTRDEPHADPRRYRRLHMISGDANLLDEATWLKGGMLALVLDLIESGWRQAPLLADPVPAFHAVSRDSSLRGGLACVDGRTLTSIDILQTYLDGCRTRAEAQPLGSETDDVLDTWQRTLDALRRDPFTLVGRLDWVTKLALLEQYRARDGLAWDDPRLAAIDLRYADLGPRGLIAALERAGRVVRLVDDGDVSAALTNPPSRTRAWLRGELIRRFPDDVVSADWAQVTVRLRGGALHVVRMREPLGHTEGEVGDVVAHARHVDEVVAGLAHHTR